MQETAVREIISPEDTALAVEFMQALYAHHGNASEHMRMPTGGPSYIFHRGEKIIGVTCILEGKNTLQLERYFDLDLSTVLPEGVVKSDIVEIARTASLGGYGNMSRFFLGLMKLVTRHAQENNTRYWIAAMKEPLVEMFRRHGWPMTDVPAKARPLSELDPMHAYMAPPSGVKIVISPIAESMELSERWLKRGKGSAALS